MGLSEGPLLLPFQRASFEVPHLASSVLLGVRRYLVVILKASDDCYSQNSA